MNRVIVFSTVFSLSFIVGGMSVARADSVAEFVETTTIIIEPAPVGKTDTPITTENMYSSAEIATMPVNGDALPAPKRMGTDERPGVRVFQNGREYWDPENRGGVNPGQTLPAKRDITYK